MAVKKWKNIRLIIDIPADDHISSGHLRSAIQAKLDLAYEEDGTLFPPFYQTGKARVKTERALHANNKFKGN